MKIRNVGYLSYLLSFDKLNILTDPTSVTEAGLKFPKSKADVVLYSDPKYYGVKDIIKKEKLNIDNDTERKMIEISSPGEYELGGVMVRRDINTGFYILDEGYLRIVYAGYLNKEAKVDIFKNLGDVDVLILPVGDGERFPEFDTIEKIINEVEPLLLIPSGFHSEGMNESMSTLKHIEDFIKQAGYANVTYEKFVSVSGAPEEEERNMSVSVLQ